MKSKSLPEAGGDFNDFYSHKLWEQSLLPSARLRILFSLIQT